MMREATEPWSSVELQGQEREVALQNRAASLTLWTGLGAILSLLLTCLLGSFRLVTDNIVPYVLILGVLLVASVIIFFVPSKKDERWFIVSSLLNHAGIGVAVLFLLQILGLEIRLMNLVVSGLPAAAILFGAVMFYLGAEEGSRKRLLQGGLVLLAVICLGAVIMYFRESTEFWLCMAVCALLSCAGLGALIWTNANPEGRSIQKALAVVSFSVYLLMLAAAAVALFVVASGSGSSSNRNKSRSKNSNSKKGGLFGSGGVLGGIFGGERSTRSTYRVRTFWFPGYLWYFTPYTRYAAIDRMEGLSMDEREAQRRRYRSRRAIVLAVVAVIVIALIALAILMGRR